MNKSADEISVIEMDKSPESLIVEGDIEATIQRCGRTLRRALSLPMVAGMYARELLSKSQLISMVNGPVTFLSLSQSGNNLTSNLSTSYLVYEYNSRAVFATHDLFAGEKVVLVDSCFDPSNLVGILESLAERQVTAVLILSVLNHLDESYSGIPIVSLSPAVS